MTTTKRKPAQKRSGAASVTPRSTKPTIHDVDIRWVSACQAAGIDGEGNKHNLSRIGFALGWSAGTNSFGEINLSQLADGNLHVDTESVSADFIRAVFAALAERVIAADMTQPGANKPLPTRKAKRARK